MSSSITAHRRTPLALLASLLAGSTLHAASPDAEAEKVAFFEKKIRPILVESCYTCHSAETKPSGGLRVDDRNGLLLGGNAGPAIVAGKPEESLLLQRIVHADPKKLMPKEGDKLTDAQIADLTTWIKDGAAWPRERIPTSLTRANPEFESLKKSHWSLQPVKDAKVPEVKDRDWAETEVDRFVLATLEAKNLPPVADADRATWIRRVTYDLTGLPPTPEEIAAFLKDTSGNARAEVVDRLLESPSFGERWGRHWLDVARYGESTGPSRNIPYPHAWKYRDYVIDAVNRDVPFDRFIQEQVAGDLLPSSSNQERDRQLTATGFLALGVKDVNQRFKVRFVMDNVDEQIDAVTRSVLGLTVNCARCHDHKFDPVPMTDYYALAGIFTSTENGAGVRNKMGGGGLDYYDPVNLIRLSSTSPPPPEEKVKELEARVAEAKKAFEEIRGTPEGLKKAADGRPVQRGYRTRFENLQSDLLALTDPAAQGHAVHGVREAKVIADTEVRLRGEAERLGPAVPRGFLSAVEVPGAPVVDPAQSGRLQLAQWLTSEKNPLTARVAVNRIWQHLFGDGLVTTVDNFGVNGDRPSHPELLDYLAQEFVRQGWSTKKLVRTLALSHVYRLGTEAPAGHVETDPANRLVWRHSPRRLSAEEMRDSMLASAGRLVKKPEASPVNKLRMVEMRDNGAEAAALHVTADQAVQRSVYLPLLRGVTPKALEAFDPVEQTLVSGQRTQTTVPTQALYLMNSTFVRQQSLELAGRLLKQAPASSQDLDERVRQAYLLTLGREPTRQEVSRAGDFVAAYAASYEPPVVAEKAAASPAPVLAALDSKAVETPVNSDDVDRTETKVAEASVIASGAEEAAWMSLAQALYASAEFRFVR
ncbi:MAG TPA: PSD1 and planctomycete cytochrome C domain-containing protein [Prosthecobacter sp.]